MRIGGFQKLTLLDYPGQVACIVFTRGCNFRCPFCHNSDLVLSKQEENDVPEDTIFSYLEKRKNLLDGVVITGGEPLVWPDLPDFLCNVRKQGYNIKLDTNGSFPERLKLILDLKLIDYVAVDIKQSPKQYETASGMPSDEIVPLIRQSLQILGNSGIPFELRTTVVKGIHNLETMTALAAWISSFSIAGSVPYYLQPYVNSGHVIAPEGLSSFSDKELEEMLSAVRRDCPLAALRK